MNGLIRLAVGTAVLAVSVAAGAQALYQDESAPVDARVADLIGRLTTEEKVGLLRATSPAIPRLGIDKYYHGNEALHGVVRPGRFTVFPQAVGLAATWNTDLIYSVATAISDEARTLERARPGEEADRAIYRPAYILVAHSKYGSRSRLGAHSRDLR